MNNNKITLQDLRIGNYVKYSEDIFKVIGIESFPFPGITVIDKIGDIFTLKLGDPLLSPIKLNITLIEKLGFFEEDSLNFLNTDGYLNLWYDKDDSEFLTDSIERFILPDITIKFLHELQNLYFSLIKKDLKISHEVISK